MGEGILSPFVLGSQHFLELRTFFLPAAIQRFCFSYFADVSLNGPISFLSLQESFRCHPLLLSRTSVKPGAWKRGRTGHPRFAVGFPLPLVKHQGSLCFHSFSPFKSGRCSEIHQPVKGKPSEPCESVPVLLEWTSTGPF